MNVTIEGNEGTIKGILCYDINGNVYIEINNCYHVLSIDKNNDIEFYKINNNAFKTLSNEVKIHYNDIMQVNGESLKKKILDNVENDSESDGDENYQNFKHEKKYCEEDKYFIPKTENKKLEIIKMINRMEMRSTARVECQTNAEAKATNNTEANALLICSALCTISPADVI